MNREEILTMFQACMVILDGGRFEQYEGISSGIWASAEALVKHLRGVEG